MTSSDIQYQFDVAISFAGEDRQTAESLARALMAQGFQVFYDQYQQAELWGKDLYQHLQKVYRDSARYCLIIVSESYTKRLWTQHELKQAQARALSENEEYILPLRIDDSELPGLNPTIGYVDLRNTSVHQAALLVAEKLLRTLKWSTWRGTPTTRNEFTSKTRAAVDRVVALACSEIAKLTVQFSVLSALVAAARKGLSTIPIETSADVELTVIDDSGVFVYHPWPAIVGRTVASQWPQREEFAEWMLCRFKDMGAGYLTWEDCYSSDPLVEVETIVHRRTYTRRTVQGFRRIVVPGAMFWTVAVEGHEVAQLGHGRAFE